MSGSETSQAAPLPVRPQPVPVPASPVLRRGTLIDHFQVMRLIGRGGMGEVYLVRDTKLGRRAALKVISTEHLGSAEAVEGFLNEARTTARFSHPNIVTIHAVGEHEGRPYVALEYLEGQNLRERVQERQPSLQEALRIVLAVAEALREAHANGVLHLDLKPENIVIPRDGRVRVVDFGLAKTFLVPDAEAPADNLAPGVRAAGWGTPSYVAPEQWRYRECTGATDVWALGVITYELCSGRLPFPQEQIIEKGKAICSRKPAPRLDEAVEVPQELADLVARCLEKDQANRATPQEIVEGLEDLLHARHGTTIEDNPYRGLAPFTQMHAALFFGRNAEVSALVERLRHEPTVTVVGPPGAGKSSLVQAGVIPRLLEQDRWLVIRTRPGTKPFLTLAERIHRHQSAAEARRTHGGFSSAAPFNDLDSAPSESSTMMVRSALDENDAIEELARQLEERPARLSMTLRSIAEDQQTKVLLVVEQLEELHTMVDSRRTRHRFMQAVCGSADDPMEPVRVLLTIRDDFLGRAATSPEARDALARVMVIQTLGREALSEILTRPLAAVGYRFEDAELVREMTSAVAGQPGSLPLLQFAAAKLWEQRDQTRRVLLRSAYRQMGGVEGALAQHADGSLDAMSAEQQRLAREILLRLVTMQRTRRVVSQTELLDGLGEQGARVFARLTTDRLLTVRTRRSSDTGPTVELVHESLLRTWGTLTRWLEEAKGDLAFVSEITQAAQLWDRRGRLPQELWQGDAVRDARRMTGRSAAELPEVARDFLEASIQRERRRQRRRQTSWALTIGTLVVIALGSVLVALLVADKEQEALRQRDLAERQRGEAFRAAARAAFERGQLLEARARLRSALELDDSPSARALWRELASDPRIWTKPLGALLYSVDYGRDGRRLVVGSQDGSVYSVDPRTRATRILRGADDQVYSVRLSPDGSAIAAGAWSGRVFLWRGDDDDPSAVLETHGGAVRGLAWAPDGQSLATATQDGKLAVWSIDTQKPLHIADSERVSGIAASPTFDTIAIASEAGLQLWQPGSAPAETSVTESVWSVDWSPDGASIAAGGAEERVVVWDVARAIVVDRLAGHRASVRAVAFSSDSKLLASGSYDKTVRLWELETSATLAVFEGHEAGVEGIAFGAKAKRLVSVGRDRTVRLWRLGVREKAEHSSGHRAAVYRVAFSPDGSLIASASGDQTIRLWDVDSGLPIRTLAGHTAGVDVVVFSPDGSRVASAGVDLTVRTWDVDSGAERRVLTGNTARIAGLAYDRTGTKLASVSRDGFVTLFDLETGATIDRSPAHEGGTYGVDFSPADATLVTGGDDGLVALWDTDPLRRLRVIGRHSGTVHGVGFGPDGKSVVSGSSDRTLRVWDLATNESRAFGPHGGRVYWAEIDHQGRRIGAPSSDGVVTIWDLQDESHVELSGHQEEVNSVSFSPDGDLVVTGGDDGTVRLWDAATGSPRWRAPLYLTNPPRIASHRGWVALEDGRPAQRPATAWAEVVEKDAGAASLADDGRLLCLRDHAGAVALWDAERDRNLASPGGTRFTDVVAGHEGCLARDDEAAYVLDPTGELVEVDVDGTVVAIGPGPDGYLLVADDVHAVDDSGKVVASWRVGPAATAAARVGPYLLVGFADGNLEALRVERETIDPAGSFEQTEASRVERIMAGPPGTVAVGYANGHVGLWNLADGSRLTTVGLHGRVVHLSVESQKLYAATDLGDFVAWNLETFYRGYCDLLEEVWRETPVIWRQGTALEASADGHRCRTAPAQR